MKELRRLSRNNVFTRSTEVIENKVVLHETGGVVTTWDIEKDEHTLLISFPEADTTSVFESIHNYVENRTDSPQYYAIDLNHTMFSDLTQQKTARVAFSVEEALELTNSLVSEIDEREAGKTGHKIRIVLKDGAYLFALADSENEAISEVLTNLRVVLERGAAVGITLLMEIDTDTAEYEETHPAFTDAIILK